MRGEPPVAAQISSGRLITYHLNRAMDNDLTRSQASEVITHIAFYAGWPNAFSALPVVKEVFEKAAEIAIASCTSLDNVGAQTCVKAYGKRFALYSWLTGKPEVLFKS